MREAFHADICPSFSNKTALSALKIATPSLGAGMCFLSWQVVALGVLHELRLPRRTRIGPIDF